MELDQRLNRLELDKLDKRLELNKLELAQQLEREEQQLERDRAEADVQLAQRLVILARESQATPDLVPGYVYSGGEVEEEEEMEEEMERLREDARAGARAGGGEKAAAADEELGSLLERRFLRTILF